MKDQAPTPETDALNQAPFFNYAERYVIMLAHARRLELERDAARAALREIARQHLADEMDDHTSEHADWHGGYEEVVKIARTAIQKPESRTPNPES